MRRQVVGCVGCFGELIFSGFQRVLTSALLSIWVVFLCLQMALQPIPVIHQARKNYVRANRRWPIVLGQMYIQVKRRTRNLPKTEI